MSTLDALCILHLPQPCYTEGDADSLLRLYERTEDAVADEGLPGDNDYPFLN